MHSFDVDFSRSASLETVCRLFLEAAWNHAEALGFGYSHLAAQGRLWVLSRLVLQVHRFPSWGDAVDVITWPRPTHSVFAMREFELRMGETLMASGSSGWLILDAASRRPQRTDRLLAALPNPLTTRATETDPPKLVPLAAPFAETRTPVTYSDIDVNNHVNSCRYVGMLLDTYPLEFFARHEPVRLHVNYLGETHGGETLVIRTTSSAADGLERQHSIAKEDGREVLRADLAWRLKG